MEARVFRVVNGVVVPVARTGLTFPFVAPGGILVLEMKGRKTGRRIELPLMAANLGGVMLAATGRAARSQWLQNLAAKPSVQVWLWGRRRPVHAYVVAPGRRVKGARNMPVAAQLLAGALARVADVLDVGFALLVPR